jgi:hypothetical protein
MGVRRFVISMSNMLRAPAIHSVFTLRELSRCRSGVNAAGVSHECLSDHDALGEARNGALAPECRAPHRMRCHDELLSEHRVFDDQLFARAEEIASKASCQRSQRHASRGPALTSPCANNS